MYDTQKFLTSEVPSREARETKHSAGLRCIFHHKQRSGREGGALYKKSLYDNFLH